MKNILLYNPPTGLYRRDNRCQNRVEDQTVNVVFPPMELLYPAAVLEQAGHQVWVRDYPALHADWDTFQADLCSIKPDIVIMTTTIATLESDLSTARLVKENNPTTITAAKGEPLHYMDTEIIRNTKGLDIILRGEIESYVADFAEDKPWDTLPGVTFLLNGNLVRNELETEYMDINALPFPARHLIDNELYRSPETRNKLTTVVTSLGCPHKCIFCSVPAMTGVNVRFRTPESIVEELDDCVTRFGIREFLFHADTFTLKKPWVIELCQRILDRGLDIRWGCNSRVDTIDAERLQWMKKAGCWVVGFGVESGNDRHLEWMKKRATGNQAKEAVKLCREHGIRSHAFFVFGFPWDTEETICELVEFAKELDPDFFDFNVAFPLPGTELDRMAEEKNVVDKEMLRNGGYAVGGVWTETLSPEDLQQWRRKALWHMYLRPHYIYRTLRNAGSPGVVLNYLRAAAGRARNLIHIKRKNTSSEVKAPG
ncbi:radical SAM protein [bacterium]|nr:radical SAM protein [bacterium]